MLALFLLRSCACFDKQKKNEKKDLIEIFISSKNLNETQKRENFSIDI